MAFHLLTGLARLPGIELCVMLLNHGTLAEKLRAAGVPTCVLDERKHSFPGIVRQAAATARRWAPQVLHSHRYKENLLAFLASLVLEEKAALVSTLHGMPEMVARDQGLSGRLKLRLNERLLASWFDKTVAVSADIRQSLTRAHGFRESRVEVIRNGIGIPGRRDRAARASGFVIGSAGRLVPVKDYPLMIEVARRLCASRNDVRFELAGEGPLLGELRELVRRHGLDERFAFRGFVADIGSFYENLDVFLNTSLHEGIPISVLEAMALGVPPVVPAVGGLREVVADGLDGYLVATRDPADFAASCAALCGDEKLRREMGRAARAKVSGEFSAERMVRDYADLYRRSRVRPG
jgi:glycosyltransferase involved in cell wall biosynthesis